MSLLAIGCLAASGTAASNTVKLTTEPPIDKIAPYEAEATIAQQATKLNVQALDSAGKPQTNVRMKVRLLTPPANPWFTTDFPIVEGTQLLDFQADAPSGQLQFQQMLPIRGNYQLQVTTTPMGGAEGTAGQQNISLTVNENLIKYQNFGKLMLMLAAAGLIGGWVIGAKQVAREGEVAPQSVRLLLSGAALVAIAALLYVNVSTEVAQSGMSEPMSHTMAGKEHGAMTAAEHSSMAEAPKESNPPDSITSQGIKLSITGDGNATVGKPASFRVKAIDEKTNQPVAGKVSIKTVNTENEDKWTAFGYEGALDSTGQLTWQLGLFDGSGHRVNVEFIPTGQSKTPLKVSQAIEVEGVAPPLYVRLIGLGYMTGITGVAFFLAFWLRQRRNTPTSVV